MRTPFPTGAAPPSRRTFHLVMAGCALFAIAMLGLLIWVCSRPQTDDIRAAEGQSIARCWERSADPRRSAISRSAQADACREMEKGFAPVYTDCWVKSLKA